MSPGEKVGLWLLKFFGFAAIFSGCLLAEFDKEFLLHDGYEAHFGLISENSWNDLMVGASALFSALVICLITGILSGMKTAWYWMLQIILYLVLFAAIYALLPVQYLSFLPMAGGALILTTLIILLEAKLR